MKGQRRSCGVSLAYTTQKVVGGHSVVVVVVVRCCVNAVFIFGGHYENYRSTAGTVGRNAQVLGGKI